MAPAMLVMPSIRNQPIDVGVTAGGSVMLFLLALARMGGQTERKRAMQTVLRATEQERIRLAADLHDGPVQELTALRYGLTRARSRVQGGQAEQAEGLLAELEDELASGITGLRRLMAELRPPVLDEQGLEVALHNQVRAFEAITGVACAIHRPAHPPRPRPGDRPGPGHPGDAQQRRQARRRVRVTVSLEAENGWVQLRINGDGVGFDPAVAAKLLSEGHFGLAGMRERVEMVGGHLSVDSAPGKGTSVAVEMASHSSLIHVGGARSPHGPQERLCVA
jgi:two-component system sensor histidine kinase DegS